MTYYIIIVLRMYTRILNISINSWFSMKTRSLARVSQIKKPFTYIIYIYTSSLSFCRHIDFTVASALNILGFIKCNTKFCEFTQLLSFHLLCSCTVNSRIQCKRMTCDYSKYINLTTSVCSTLIIWST